MTRNGWSLNSLTRLATRRQMSPMSCTHACVINFPKNNSCNSERRSPLRIIAHVGTGSSTSRATIFIKGQYHKPSERPEGRPSPASMRCRWSQAAPGLQVTGRNYLESLRERQSLVLISSTSSSGVRPNAIVSTSSSNPGSSKSANWLFNNAGFMK